MELFDEVGNADVADVFTAKRFMVHFQLKKQIDNVEELVPVDLRVRRRDLHTLCECGLSSKELVRVHDEFLANGDVLKEHAAVLKVLNEAFVT